MLSEAERPAYSGIPAAALAAGGSIVAADVGADAAKAVADFVCAGGTGAPFIAGVAPAFPAIVETACGDTRWEIRAVHAATMPATSSTANALAP
jgi:hypothetical protein